jgi:elongation factor 1-gamma
LVAIKLLKAPVAYENVPYDAPNREELKKLSPTGTMPLLKTPEGVISEGFAIVQYLGEVYNPSFLGSTPLERAAVRQWNEFTAVEVNRNNAHLVYPIFGYLPYVKENADNALKEIKGHFALLNTHLEGKTFLVGNHITSADLNLWTSVGLYLQFVFADEARKKLFPNLVQWWLNLANMEEFKSIWGRPLLNKVPAKYPASEKKEEPKKEAKKEEKKTEKTGGDDEDEAPKKKKNPLDSLPPTTFVFDDFKKEFLNSKDRKAVLDEFWKKIDLNGFSFWFMHYQKLPSEGKVLFRTNNSLSIFLQNLDPFRKYCFSAHGIYGEEGNYEIRGVWMWRGLDIPAEIKEHDSFEYMTIKKLDPTQENDRKLIEEYWLKTEEGQVVDGLPVANVVYHK